MGEDGQGDAGGGVVGDDFGQAADEDARHEGDGQRGQLFQRRQPVADPHVQAGRFGAVRQREAAACPTQRGPH